MNLFRWVLPPRFAPSGTPRTDGAAVTLPSGLAWPAGLQGGGRPAHTHHHYTTVVMPDIANRPPADDVHDGNPDLERWYPSTVELGLAADWLAAPTPTLSTDLQMVCGSEERAFQIICLVRRRQQVDRMLTRLFGPDPATTPTDPEVSPLRGLT